MNNTPIIDKRTWEEIDRQAMELASQYVPEWSPDATKEDHGRALIQLFSRLMEIVINRLNRVPEKNFLAFLDVAGITTLPPRAARAPVRFFLSKGAREDGRVPAGTPLGATVPEGEPINFETEKAITVTRSRLKGLYALDPEADKYTDLDAALEASENNSSVGFQPFAGSSLIPHVLYMGHETLFNISRTTTVNLIFRLPGNAAEKIVLFKKLAWMTKAHGQPFQFSLDDNIFIKDETDDPNLDPQTILVTLTVKDVIDKLAMKAGGSFCIWAETTGGVTAEEMNGLSIESIKATTSSKDISPSQAFFNATPLDLTNIFYPFGHRPKLHDTFYLAVPEAFSKKGSTVELEFDFEPGLATGGVIIQVEFWDGEQWVPLGKANKDGEIAGGGLPSFTDSTNAFTVNNGGIASIEFIAPIIEKTQVNGKEDYWIRLRIAGGNYGEDASYVQDTSAGGTTCVGKHWIYSEHTFQPPVINSISASCEYLTAEDLTFCLTHNNFSFREINIEDGLGFDPFAAMASTIPQLYLGFDERFANDSVTIYISVLETIFTEPPMVVWQYWNGSEWENLGITDETKNLTESGVIEFIGPLDFNKSLIFGKELFWVRARLEKGDKEAFNLRGIYPNTAWARNSVSIKSESIGSSKEAPNAVFRLSRTPVLEGQIIEVREPEKPTEQEMQTLMDEGGPNAAYPAGNGEQESPECWVRWHEVEHFRFSDGKSRHYTLDRATGRVFFGDGTRGMIPPAGRDNIRALRYLAGGGERGNVPKGSINVMKRAVKFIDRAVSVDETGGGCDVEAFESLRARGPQAIKHRERAVTSEDYEWLARESSLQVARAKCLTVQPGKVELIIVPVSDDRKPCPSQGLIRTVKEYLTTRRILTADLTVTAPKYVSVSVSADIYPEIPAEADRVRRLVTDTIEAYLHPLKGGPDSNGWAFGRDVYVSEVCKVIEDIKGVHHAENVSLSSASTEGADHIEVGEYRLISSGAHTVTIEGKSGSAAQTGISDFSTFQSTSLYPGNTGSVDSPSLDIPHGTGNTDLGDITAQPIDLGAYPYLGNSNSMELHDLQNTKPQCQIDSMSPQNRRPFASVSEAKDKGYDFCAWCFGKHLSKG